jgi:preprotein translocase subunit SecG
MQIRKLLPLSGVVFVALVIVAILLGGSTPGSTASGAKVASYFDSHGARMFIEAFLLTAAALFAVLFAATLGRLLSEANDGVRSIWSRVALGGGVLVAAALGLLGVLTFALADNPTKVSGSALQALNLVTNDMWVVVNGALGVLMIGAAGSWLASRREQRWLGWAALVLGIALFIPFADFVALLVSGLWIIVASIVLFRGEDGERYAVAPTTA